MDQVSWIPTLLFLFTPQKHMLRGISKLYQTRKDFSGLAALGKVKVKVTMFESLDFKGKF